LENKNKLKVKDKEISSYNKNILKITTNQERLRQNIKSLENVKSDQLIEK